MSDDSRTNPDYSRRHLRFGWWSLFVFTTFGLLLELFHGFKVRAYLDVSNETRRLMWTLAHAHGSLLALVHVMFGLSVRAVPELGTGSQRLISSCLIAASCALPGGFFLGGIVIHGGDPSLGVLLLPVGAMLLLVAIFRLARRTASLHSLDSSGPGGLSRAQKASQRDR